MRKRRDIAKPAGGRVLVRGVLAFAMFLACLLLAQAPAVAALKAIDITTDTDRLDISALVDSVEFHEPQGDQITIETAPGADGITQRLTSSASTPGRNPAWFAFALRNATDKPVERWLAVDRYNMAGSGVVWPDLDARRIEKISHSIGYVPERIKSDRADVFRITLEPGQTVTYLAELSSDRFARIYLWNGLEYEQKSRDRQLFNGIMMGITGLLAVFLTAVFAANHKAIFPAAAVLTWCVLAYLCVDFGFWHKLFNIRPEENAQYRAAAEAAMAASLLVFVYVFLRLRSWHGFVRMLLALWIAAQAVLIAVAFIDPRLAATFARLSSLAIASGRGGRHVVPGIARAGPGAFAASHLDAAVRVAVRHGRHVHRPAGRRFHHLRPDLGPRADRGADRLHRHAVRLPLDRADVRHAAGRAAIAGAGRRRRRRRRVGMELAPRRNQGEPDRRGHARTQVGRAVLQGRRFHRAHASSRPRAVQAPALVDEGALGRRHAHRVPHAPRGQFLSLVRAGRRQRADLRPPQPALRRPAARSDRRQARARAAAAQRRARQPFRPSQSRAVPGPAGDCRQTGHARASGAALPAVRRHRQVQDGQLRIRPRGRRQSPAHRGAAPRTQPGAAGYAGPHRRRPVRAPAAQPDRPARARHAGRAGAPRGAHGHHHRRPGDRSHRLHRHLHL